MAATVKPKRGRTGGVLAACTRRTVRLVFEDGYRTRYHGVLMQALQKRPPRQHEQFNPMGIGHIAGKGDPA